MDAILAIVMHHLAQDGARPLRSVSTPHDGSSPPAIDISLVEDVDAFVTAFPGLPRDKIVIYSYFVSNFPSIEKVR
jgi:hypothetical protein